MPDGHLNARWEQAQRRAGIGVLLQQLAARSPYRLSGSEQVGEVVGKTLDVEL